MSSRDVSGPYRPASPSAGSYGRPRQDRPVSRSVRGGYDGGRSGRSGVDYPTENFPGPAADGYRPPPGATRDSAGYRAREGRYGAGGRLPPGPQRRGPRRRRRPQGRTWRRSWRRPRPGQGQGQLVAALDLAEGGRPPGRRLRRPGPADGRRGQLRLREDERPHRRVAGGDAAAVHRLLQRRQDARRHVRQHRPAVAAATTRSPACMRDAVVAAEDRSFYTEGGVSPRGIMRAAYEDVFNSGGGGGGSLQGGSTITQQFVRNYYANIGTQQTASRKIKEIFVALKVAKEKSKAWILTQLPEHHLPRRGGVRRRRGRRDLLRGAGFAAHRRAGRDDRRRHPEPELLPDPGGPSGPRRALALRSRRDGHPG